MMVVPVDTEVDKAQYVTQKHRDQGQQHMNVFAMRHLQFQHHDGDDDGDHAIAEGFQPVVSHERHMP